MDRASSRSPVTPIASGLEVMSREAAGEESLQVRLLLILSFQAAAFALASASGKMPEFAVFLFRALLIF